MEELGILTDRVLDEDDVPEEENYGVLDTYADYRCDVSNVVPSYERFIHPHPVLETASLGSVCGPLAKFALKIPKHIFEERRLSNLQAETISIVCARHAEFLMDGARAGFLIGDGAGIGKGRTIAGIICENFLRHRPKSLWLSINAELMDAAERDFRDLDVANLQIVNLKKIPYQVPISSAFHSEDGGCLFASYSTVIQKSNKNNILRTRLSQLIDWLTPDFDGVVVFDECHRTKNLIAHYGHPPSQTALAVQNIQQKLPQARIVYASATGACNPSEMGYMSRLGLWGPKSPFKSFVEFLEAVKLCGVVGMESVAMDMKYRGVYVARQLSFHGASFSLEVCQLTKSDLDVYNYSVEAWVVCLYAFTQASDLVGLDKAQRKILMLTFWSAHLRYFKTLCVSLKVHTVVKIARESIAMNQCVVLGLQGTGEANLNDFMTNSKCGNNMSKGVSVCEGILRTLMSKFPAARTDGTLSERLNSLNASVMAAIKNIDFPLNPLDVLIEELGGPEKVSEMTGRRWRVILDPVKLTYKIETRSMGAKIDNVNMMEKEMFMNGTKRVAIISDAASVGISLHSDLRADNRCRRIHITLELPWAADKAIQQFGRTLRSNQANSPHYILCVSKVGGETRFASAVARRLESLGAITQGDRRSTDMHKFAAFNIDNEYGKIALRKCVKTFTMTGIETVVTRRAGDSNFITNARKHLQLAGFSAFGAQNESPRSTREVVVAKFLNRLLGVKMPLQNDIFEYFSEMYEAVVRKAKKDGTFNEGIVELSNSEVQITNQTTYPIGDHGACHLYTVEVERGMTWPDAVKHYGHNVNSVNGFYVDKSSRKKVPYLVVSNESETICSVWRPNTGFQTKKWMLDEITRISTKIEMSEAESLWRERYNSSATDCSHIWWTGRCKLASIGGTCSEGLRHKTHLVLAGSFWLVMPNLKNKVPSIFSNIQLCRFTMKGEGKVAGILIPSGKEGTICSELNSLKEKWSKIALQECEEELGESDSSDNTDNSSEHG